MHYVLFTGSPRSRGAISLRRHTTHGSQNPKGFASRQWWPPTWWPTLKPLQPPVRSTVPSGVLGAAFNLLERRHSAAVAPIYCACRTRCHRKSWTERAHTQFSPGPIASMLPFNRWLLSEGSFVSKFCGKCCRQRAMYRLALIALPLTSRARARCQRRSVSASSTRLMVPRMTEQQVDARCDGSTLFWQRHDAAVSRARPYVKKCQLMRPRECMPRASVTQPVWGMYYSCPSGICEP